MTLLQPLHKPSPAERANSGATQQLMNERLAINPLRGRLTWKYQELG